MKKIFNLSICLLTAAMILAPVITHAQTQINNDYNNLYLNKTPFRDLRTHDESNIGIVVMVPISIDLPKVIDDNVHPDDPEDYNRLPESGFPGLRFFKGNRTKTFSFVYARKAYKFDGSGDSKIGSTYKSYLEKQSKSRIALRFAYDWHFKPNRFKWFDLDHYFGYSANAGLAPSINTTEKEFLIGGGIDKITRKSNPITIGGDVYWGLNAKFEYFSIGAEFLLFGMDYQKNVGREKVELESNSSGTLTSSTYYTTDYDGPNNLSGESFSSLKSGSSQITMFKGFRLSAVIYLKNPKKNQ